jgi:hypothetical protein
MKNVFVRLTPVLGLGNASPFCFINMSRVQEIWPLMVDGEFKGSTLVMNIPDCKVDVGEVPDEIMRRLAEINAAPTTPKFEVCDD